MESPGTTSTRKTEGAKASICPECLVHIETEPRIWSEKNAKVVPPFWSLGSIT